MKIVKPLRLGLLARPYQMRRRKQLGLAVLALASLDESPRLQPEPDLWKLAAEALDEDSALDLAIPKPCAEFLVSGKAYTAHQEDRTACAARVRVGSLEKHLVAFGDRYWLDGRPTRPAVFDAMPLDWAHAYGGPSHAENPRGRGADEEVVNGVRTRRLPNVEPWLDRIGRPEARPEPAGFGPVPPVAPRRSVRAGQYDPSWLDSGFPGFLDSLDPHYFNAASPDQWWPGQPELEPGAAYALWNLHPRRACLSGSLPCWRARCFLRRTGKDALEEADMRLTTAWFFPDRERVLLIYHGSVELATDDGADMALAMPALEEAGAPRALSHYAEVLANRLDPVDGALHALRDKDLLPQTILAPWDALQVENPLEQPLAVNQRARGEALRAQMREKALADGVDPAAFDVQLPEPPKLPQLDELPDRMRQMRQAAQEAHIDALHRRREMAEMLRARESQMPPGMSAAGLQARIDKPGPGGPPSLSAGSGFAGLQQMAGEPAAEGLNAAALDAMATDAQQKLGELYRVGAHHQPAAASASPTRIARMRRRVEALMQGSRDLSGLDLTGVDLSGMDLRGARCVGTWMEAADLSGTVLDGADLSRAVLTRVQAKGGSWRGVNLAEANLGRASLTGVDLSEASFTDGVVLDGLSLTHCVLVRARLVGCNLAGARLLACDFSQATLEATTFWQRSVLRDTRFTGAELLRVVWLDCTLDAVSYAQARIRRSAWVQSRFGRPGDWSGAELETCAVVETRMPGAVFTGAVLRQCALRGIALDGADFGQATLQRCDLSEASLTDATLARARADESLFIRANLTGATLADADLMGALLQKATLERVDLRGANLFRADLGQALLDDTTDTRGAYVALANTRPLADRSGHGR
jgi:uncharacterized protein YjbI with pentapeptide repeats